jgi:anti-anti-sigma regulatory factor
MGTRKQLIPFVHNWYAGSSSAILFFSVMFSIEVSDAERLIKISWSGKVDSEEMRRCAEEMSVAASKIRPGFRLLADMTCLESMDSAGAPYIGSVMDLCVAKQVEHVVRVIPDPHKDIGLNIMSYFHYGSKVRVTICDNLADALRRLAE